VLLLPLRRLPRPAAYVPDRFDGKVSASWLEGMARGAERTRQTDHGVSGTSPETMAEIRATAAPEHDSLAAFKKPLSADEKREGTLPGAGQAWSRRARLMTRAQLCATVAAALQTSLVDQHATANGQQRHGQAVQAPWRAADGLPLPRRRLCARARRQRHQCLADGKLAAPPDPAVDDDDDAGGDGADAEGVRAMRDPLAAAGCFTLGALMLVVTAVLALVLLWPYLAIAEVLAVIFIMGGALYLRGDAPE